jgi:hypothetical protein
VSETNGATTPVVPPPAIDLLGQLARYRTAIVALLQLVKREGGFMSWGDQMLLREIERLIDSDGARVVQAQLDREKIE